MQNDFTFELNTKMFDELQAYSEILKKDTNTILNEALKQYFESQQKKLLEKNMEDENAMTNLDYDEFWDGVDI